MYSPPPFSLTEKMLRQRPIRARVYQQITRFGVPVEDWKYILGSGVAGWSIPMLLKMDIAGIPLFLLAGPGALFISYSFFFWAHVGKRPMWLRHQFESMLRPYVDRGALPSDRAKRPLYPWIR